MYMKPTDACDMRLEVSPARLKVTDDVAVGWPMGLCSRRPEEGAWRLGRTWRGRSMITFDTALYTVRVKRCRCNCSFLTHVKQSLSLPACAHGWRRLQVDGLEGESRRHLRRDRRQPRRQTLRQGVDHRRHTARHPNGVAQVADRGDDCAVRHGSRSYARQEEWARAFVTLSTPGQKKKKRDRLHAGPAESFGRR